MKNKEGESFDQCRFSRALPRACGKGCPRVSGASPQLPDEQPGALDRRHPLRHLCPRGRRGHRQRHHRHPAGEGRAGGAYCEDTHLYAGRAARPAKVGAALPSPARGAGGPLWKLL